MSETAFTVDYFIAKFAAIPEEQWCMYKFSDACGRHCALGHCNRRTGGDGHQLNELVMSSGGDVGQINDGLDERYQQDTPKQRILAALRDIKEWGAA